MEYSEHIDLLIDGRPRLTAELYQNIHLQTLTQPVPHNPGPIHPVARPVLPKHMHF